MLPEAVKPDLARHLERVREQHRRDLQHGAGWVELPMALVFVVAIAYLGGWIAVAPIVAIALAAAWGITGGAGLATAFGGFATSTWVLTLGAMSLAAAMARSGLLFRAGLFLLLRRHAGAPTRNAHASVLWLHCPGGCGHLHRLR